MDFADLRYWLATGAVVLTFLALSAAFRLAGRRVSGRVDKAFLVLAGLLALGLAGAETLAVFLAESVSAYGFAALAARAGGRRPRRAVCFAAVAVLLAPLAYFKYRGFVLGIFGCGAPPRLPAAVPVGICFYTFQAIAFVVDTARGGAALPPFLDYMSFAAFFPQIVAGPIERRGALLPQMRRFRFRWRTSDVEWGLRYVVLGLFFKLCLGDNLALCHCGDPGGNVFALWLDNVSFGLRIYFDFCGYGLSAYGVARCAGIRLTQNFASPYSACDITDFWRRWHRSLTNWFRDYVYFPLGGNRTKAWAVNLVAVFALSGLWHGASWNFVLWGLANGIAIAVHKFFSKTLGLRMPAVPAKILLLVFVFYAWMLFDAGDAGSLAARHALLLDPAGYSAAAAAALPRLFTAQFVPAFFLLPLSALVVASETVCVRRKRNPYAMLLSLPALCAEILLTFLLSSGHANEFMYFAF